MTVQKYTIVYTAQTDSVLQKILIYIIDNGESINVIGKQD